MGDITSEADDAILQTLASNGTMDYSEWPRLLPNIVARIEKIAHTEFPIPQFPAPRPPQPPRAPSPRFLAPLPSSDPIDGPESSDTAAESNDNNKENALPSSSPLGSRSANVSSSSTLQAAPSSPPLPNSTPHTSQQLPSQPPQQEQVLEPGPLPGTLPTNVAGLLNEVTSTLTLNFPTYPPHTVQRLAELVIKPKQHYRSVVSYLHALDRVVHVTSGANRYPLPPAVPDQAALSQLVNGGGSSTGPSGVLSINTAAARVGSDEALGGALLTPIPWLTGRTNGGAAARAGATGSDDGHSDTESTSPLGSGSSGPALPQQAPQPQQQRPSSSSSLLSAQTAGPSEGSGSGSGNNNPKLRTESTETIDGPNGMGSIETVSISVNGIHSTGAGLVQRGVTQGEILRQEQRAGIVPLNQFAREVQQQLLAAEEDAQMGGEDDPTADAQHDDDDDDDEIPHARGPAEIGAADMGPQPATRSVLVVAADGTVVMRGVDVEGAVGRRQDEPMDVPASPKREAGEELAGGASPKRLKDEGGPKVDSEGDVVIGEAGAEAAQEVPVAKEDEDKEMTGGEAGTEQKGAEEANAKI
ncbi:hypothetical protein B0T18DRAFT_390374 [Schizothecium vesticola]|uniref:Protein phosphatase 4 core regulatory subunit R2 n=1 Tax=Schizothecium vesticola TaxID=314040 RepID=A0AA40K4P4_9PEZI|nr:hypothetical protein B0T18DRAFT_390374 [Schizothecium vesticola]